MKIVVLQDHLRSGGTERHSVLLSRELKARGHDVSLVTCRPGGRLAATVGCPHAVLQPFDTGLNWLAPGLTRAVLGGSPDIVLCMGQTANCFAGWLQGRAAARRLPTRVLGTLRAGDRLPRLYTWSVRRAAHVVANSEEAAGELVRAHGLPRQRVSFIRNSLVFPEGATEREESVRSRLGAGAGDLVLLSVAMFRPAKNQRWLVETLAGLPAEIPWRLWFVGDGPERARCERRVAELGLSQRVRFLGFLSDPGACYRAADIAVHASREEALSNFIIEAQAHGLPAVTCRALGMRECFIEGRTGWMLEQGDGDGFRKAILVLAGEAPAERRARAAQARAFARESFDPQTQVQAYVDLFERVCASGETARP